jgi:pimeloyl-ACP methyl ester carboxylesterase
MSDFDPKGIMIDTGGATVHVTDVGAGAPALVFLHYWGGSSRTWRPVIDRLADTTRCVAIDHRGWGRSSSPARGYAMQDLAADVTAVIAALGLSDYILVGHSMGGKVAQLLAGRRPSGLRGVVLVAPAPAKPAAIPDEARAQMGRAYETRQSVLATLDGVLRFAELDDELREQAVQDTLAGAGAAKRAWPSSGITQDVSADLASIDVPVLVIAGREDQVEPVAILQTHVLGEIPGAQLEIVEGSGHLIPLERPDELGERIAAFRTRLGAAA